MLLIIQILKVVPSHIRYITAFMIILCPPFKQRSSRHMHPCGAYFYQVRTSSRQINFFDITEFWFLLWGQILAIGYIMHITGKNTEIYAVLFKKWWWRWQFACVIWSGACISFWWSWLANILAHTNGHASSYISCKCFCDSRMLGI